MSDAEPVRYHLSAPDVLTLHDAVLADDAATERGLRDPGSIEFVVDYVEHGQFGQGPKTLHEKAFQYLRLLAANHPFVDGNKRTALNATAVFYAVNGYHLLYGEELEAMVRLLAIREDFVDAVVASDYFADRVDPVENEFELVRRLTDEYPVDSQPSDAETRDSTEGL